MASKKESPYKAVAAIFKPSLFFALHRMAERNGMAKTNIVRLAIDYFIVGKPDGQLLAIFNRPDDFKPFKQKKEKGIRTTVNLTPEQFNAVKEMAKKYYMSHTNVIRLASVATLRGMTRREFLKNPKEI